MAKGREIKLPLPAAADLFSTQEERDEAKREILNQCLKVAKGKALIRLSEGKVRAIHSAEKNGYQVFPSRRMRKDTCRHRSS